MNTIYANCILNNRPTISRCANEMQFLMSLYSPLTPAAIVVLSCLVYYYPSSVSATKVQNIISAWCESPKEIIKLLVEREFIVKKRTNTRSLYGYTISDKAAEAFMYDQSFAGDLFEDCFGELKTCFQLPKNQQFLKAYDKLHISEFSDDVQKVFGVLSQHFINYYTHPFDALEDNNVHMPGRMMILSQAGIAIKKEDPSFILSPDAAGLLFSGHSEIVRYDDLAKYATVISRCVTLQN